VDGVGVAEEVVHVAQYLLIGSDEEDADVVVLAGAYGMEGDVIGLVAAVDVGGNLAVGVAGDVLEGGGACGLLGQSVDGHDGEELVDAPRVGHGLEEGEVAEVLVGHLLVEGAEFVGDVLLVVGQFGHLVTDGPVEALYLGACLEVDDAVAEEVECLLAYVFGVVPVLEEGAAGEFVPYLGEVVHEFVVVGGGLEVLGHLGCGDAFEGVDDEDAVVGGEGASALGDDVGVWDAVLVGGFDEGPDAVVDVLLDAVVDGGLGVGGACAVVVDAQSAAAVHELDVEAHGVELDVVLCGLAQGCGDAAYLGDLAADVEVEEVEAVAELHLVEHVEGHEEFGGVKSELGGVAAAFAPLAAAVGGELDAYAEVGAYAEAACGVGDDLELGQFLDDEEDALAHLLCQEGEFDEVLVLVAVADDE